MKTKIPTSRIPIAVTVAAVMAAGSFGSPALAAPPHATLPTVQNDANVIQVASKKKHRRVHRNNNAAGAAAVMGLFGIIGGLAAQDAYRDRYYDDDGYYYGGPGPVYHSGPRYYAPRHYAPRHQPRQHYGGPGPFNGGTSVYPTTRNMPGSNVKPPDR